MGGHTRAPLVAAALLTLLGGRARAQGGATAAPALQWLWGAQAGLILYRTNFQPRHYDPVIGAHWLIRARRVGLLASYEQAFFTTDARATVAEPSPAPSPGNVSFHNLRRVMIGLLAFPLARPVQPFAGAGFARTELLDPTIACRSCATRADFNTVQDAAAREASAVVAWGMGGVDVRCGRLALFGQYVITSARKAFLLQGPSHTFQGGIRYSLGRSKDDVTDRH